jgi:hypothetical protein
LPKPDDWPALLPKAHTPMTSIGFIDAKAFPALASIVDRLLQVWPAHERFLQKSFSGRTNDVMATSETVAALVIKLADL